MRASFTDRYCLTYIALDECLATYVTESVPAWLQMFDNISKLQFVQGPGGESIANAMISSEGEMMEYRKGVPAEGKVHIHTYVQLCLPSVPM